MNPIVLTAVVIGAMGLTCGLTLALAARFLAVHEDARIEQLAELLPGANCGGCGYAGCADYGKAIIIDGAAVNLCTPGGNETIKHIAALLGVEAAAAERKVAIVLCGGDETRAERKSLYNGIADCTAATLINGGDKVCGYGCLGLGSCARVCPVAAIEITPTRLAVVHAELCIGCGACVKACPRSLIKIVPAHRVIHVLCQSKDKGPIVKKACQVGCIGCRACTKLTEDDAITMDGFLAIVDYTKPLDHEAIVEKCPGHCIVRRDAVAAAPAEQRDTISGEPEAAAPETNEKSA